MELSSPSYFELAVPKDPRWSSPPDAEVEVAVYMKDYTSLEELACSKTHHSTETRCIAWGNKERNRWHSRGSVPGRRAAGTCFILKPEEGSVYYHTFRGHLPRILINPTIRGSLHVLGR